MLEGSILSKLDQTHRYGKQPLNLGVYYKNTLVALCHALEDFILDSKSAPLMITAFQRGKWYLEEADRYSALADKSEHVTIMATPDSGFDSHPTSKKDNVSLVYLKESDPVAEEWHLMILSPTYTAMVLCQELSDADYGDNKPQKDLERKFYGFWTFEPELVSETVDIAIAHIAEYEPELAKLMAAQVEKMTAESATRQRDDLDAVVSQVVKYLQDSHKILNQPDSGLLHRVGLPDVTREHNKNSQAQQEVLSNQSAPKASVLRVMPQLEAISKILTHQREAWDGSGIPAKLAYDGIPLESRILCLLSDFQQKMKAYKQYSLDKNPVTQALADCQALAGKRYDPKLLDALSLLVMGMQQGMTLQAYQPKIATGMWLVDYEGVEKNKTPLS